ncbi:MAG: pseudouridine synthase [Ruminococcus sp.]
MRLDRYLSERTEYSRSQIKELAAKGCISVNGCVSKKVSMNVTESDIVAVSGKEVRQERHITLIMNKPAGIVSATEDRVEKTVIDILPPEYKNQGLAPVGRLDKDTTGMLLLTNDGSLLHELTHPKKHIPKYYRAVLARPFTAAAQQLIAEGMTLGNGEICRPARAAAIDEKGMEILICIHEGKYHQVKRMLAAAGNHVEKLCRIAIGGMILPRDLAPGMTAVLLNKDLCKVLNTGDMFSDVLNSIMKCSS